MTAPHIACAGCDRRLWRRTADPCATLEVLAEEKGWHALATMPGRRRQTVHLCNFCWAEVREGESPEGSRAPSIYVQGMEDGEDHCAVCNAVIDSDEGHTHAQCFEEGKNLGALDENLDCAQKLAERIGCEVDYFHSVLERVSPKQRLPGKLWVARAESCALVYERPKVKSLESITGLRLTLLVPMPPDEARFTHEHMMLVKLPCATVQVSIDDNGHTCRSDDGVTCVRCQRDMTPGSAHAAEVAS